MSLQPLPSTLRNISSHVFDKYAELINAEHPRYVARVVIARLVQCSHVMTDVELRYYRIRIDWEATYRISESSAGLFLIVLKRGCMVTIRPIESRQWMQE